MKYKEHYGFFSVLLVDALLFRIFCVIVTGVLCLIAALVLIVLHRSGKGRRKDTVQQSKIA